jgi:hypothetical protein
MDTPEILQAERAGDPAIYNRHKEHTRLVRGVAAAEQEWERLTRELLGTWQTLTELGRAIAASRVKVALENVDAAREQLSAFREGRRHG